VDLTTKHEPASGHPDVPVRMVRDTMEDIPQYALPDGYTLRWYEPGDDVHWLRIHDECEGYGELGDDLFRRDFGDDDSEIAQRMCFACRPDGTPVSTNTAWFNFWRDHNYGRVHWVATSVAEQGKGLSRPLMTAVCERLRDLGHDRAYLTTNTLRLRAILLYQRFGFRPDWEGAIEEEGWRALGVKVREIGRTLLI